MTEQINILLVEDDRNFGTVLKDYLMLHDYSVTLCEDGIKGFQSFENTNYDLCIFDVMMPKKDGFTLAGDIGRLKRNTPFIFLTAKTLKDDMLKGFKLGADDYITKPFDSEVLMLKIKAILKRHAPGDKPVQETYLIGSLLFNIRLRTIKNGSKEIKLSPKESALLELLCEHMNDILPRTKALKQIWKEDNYFTARSMDVYVAKLRKYFRADSSVNISNIHGTGYILNVDVK